MKRWGFTVTAIAALAAFSLAGSLSAASTAGKTRLTITIVGKTRGGSGTSGTFSLLGASTAYTDSGKVDFSTATEAAPRKSPEGLSFSPVQSRQTLNGKYGTLVIRSNLRGFPVVKQDDNVWTGTWSIVSGTGRYAGLKGGGALVGISQAPAHPTSFADYDFSYRYEGSVAKP